MSSSAPGLNPLYNLSPEQVLRAQSAQWRQIVRQALDDTRCASPAFLTEDLDPATQTVTVQIAIQERVRTNKGPAWTDLPIIIKVPVVLPRGGGFSLTLPLKKGDEGLLVFCDTCFDFWWKNGRTNSPVASGKTAPSGTQRQNEVRRHYVHDCGFIPGMCSQPSNLSAYSATSMQLRSDDGSTVIDVAGAAGTTTVTDALSSVALDGSGANLNASSINLTAEVGNVEVSGDLQADDNVYVGSGASGTFSTPTGQTVTVQNGIIIDIS